MTGTEERFRPNAVCICGYRKADHPRPDRHPFELSDGFTNGLQPWPISEDWDPDEVGWDA